MAAVLFKSQFGVSLVLVFEASLDQPMIIPGDYGRVEGKKVFMGVAQIMIDDLDLSNIVIGKTHVHKMHVNQGSFSP